MIYFISSMLFLSAATSIFIAVYLFFKRISPCGKIFAVLMLMTSIYSLGYAFEISSNSLQEVVFWLRFQYIGISFIPTLWLIFSLKFLSLDKWLKKQTIFVMFSLSFITFILHNTNQYHYLYYNSITINIIDSVTITSIERGFWYHIHMWYTNLSLLIGNILYINAVIKSPSTYKSQYMIIAIASFFPWAGCILYFTGISPFGIDLTPISMLFMNILSLYALFSFGLLDIIPIARDTIFDNMQDMTLVFDKYNRLVDYNMAAKELMGDRKGLIGASAECILKDYPELLGCVISNKYEYLEVKTNHSNRKSYRVSITPLKDHQLKNIGKILVFNDITQHNNLLEKLHYYATADALTGLYNRSYFFDLAAELINKKSESPVSFIIFDLDDFKNINDTYGHQAGDAVLESVAKVFKDSLRKNDIIGRYGGEEFVVLLLDTKLDEASTLAERIRESIEQAKIEYLGNIITVTGSLGISCAEGPYRARLDNLVRDADNALYEAKIRGKNKVIFASNDRPYENQI